MRSTCLLSLLLACCAVTANGAGTDDNFERMKSRDYHRGLRDAHKTYRQGDLDGAFPQLQRFACAGDKSTQFALGSMYLLGEGTAADALQAYAWYAVAAETGERKFRDARDKLQTLIPAEHQPAAQRMAEEYTQHYGERGARISCGRRPDLGSQVKELQCDLAVQRQGGFVDVRRCTAAD